MTGGNTLGRNNCPLTSPINVAPGSYSLFLRKIFPAATPTVILALRCRLVGRVGEGEGVGRAKRKKEHSTVHGPNRINDIEDTQWTIHDRAEDLILKQRDRRVSDKAEWGLREGQFGVTLIRENSSQPSPTLIAITTLRISITIANLAGSTISPQQ